MTVAEYEMYIASIDDMEHRAIDDKQIGDIPVFCHFHQHFPGLAQVCFTLGFLTEMISKMLVEGFLPYISSLVFVFEGMR